MSVLPLLSSALGLKSQKANEDLAEQITIKNNHFAVKELVENLYHKNRNIQHDCLKTLYEVGSRNPKLISEYIHHFTELLNSRNNRMQWGCMIALDYITFEKPHELYKHLNQLLKITDNGTVITRDHMVSILTKLYTFEKYADDMFELLCEQLKISPTNQLPKYAEDFAKVIKVENIKKLKSILEIRLNDFEESPKKKRLLKVIQKMSK